MSDKAQFDKWYTGAFGRRPTEVGYETDICWQAWQAAREQGGEAVPVAWWDGDMEDEETSFQFEESRHYNIPLYTHPQPAKVPEWVKAGVWQFYQDGEWRVGMNCNNHRENTEEAGFPVRDLYVPVIPPEGADHE